MEAASANDDMLAVRLVSLAKKVRSGATAPGDAVNALSAEFRLNRNSARDYISGVRAMLAGQEYQRRLKLSVSQTVLDEILRQDGRAGAETAISAVRKHVKYYLSVNGNGQPGLVSHCANLEAKFAASSSNENEEFEMLVRASMKLPRKERAKMLPPSGYKPDFTFRQLKVFKRNQHVVAEVLQRAEGVCEGCQKPAPFKRRTDGSPYLEVHHLVTLAENGEDTVDNAIALCPNCHRKRHLG